MARQGWEPGGNPSQVPRKGKLTATGRGNVPAEPEVGDGQQPRTLGRKEPTPQEVVLTAGEQGDVRAWALSCREAHAWSVPQPGPGKGGLSSPRSPPLMTVSHRLSLSSGQSSWEQGRPHRVSGAGVGAVQAGSLARAQSPLAAGGRMTALTTLVLGEKTLVSNELSRAVIFQPWDSFTPRDT